MKNFIFIFIQISGFLLLQNPIFAHQPFGIADKNQDSYIEVSDAKISHAFYGIFDKKGEQMELNFKLSAGDTFVFSLLIPDQDPENILASERLPELVINNEKFTSNQKSNFYEPYSRMNLIRIIDENKVIESDTDFNVKVISNGQSRFVFSLGYQEIFNKTVASGNVRRFNSGDLSEWYNSIIILEEENNNNFYYALILVLLTVVISFILYFRHDIQNFIFRN
ncbi:MAG: hypothetical protein VX521_00110 [Chloroflexota bacterium]|nr:hypothetical protein [Chloroflexota bacterium]MEC9098490.1 hypothetical protein [Chloroflexota bacterium]MED5237136.1 hypothetical protein [Chloroflexota bacterium]